jgi:hypothetical protein
LFNDQDVDVSDEGGSRIEKERECSYDYTPGFTVDFTFIWKPTSFDCMQAALRAFVVDENERQQLHHECIYLWYLVLIPSIQYHWVLGHVLEAPSSADSGLPLIIDLNRAFHSHSSILDA